MQDETILSCLRTDDAVCVVISYVLCLDAICLSVRGITRIFPQSCAQHHISLVHDNDVHYTGVHYARDTGPYRGYHLEMGWLSDFRPSSNE